MFKRANLFKKNVATEIETDSLEIALKFHHALVKIDETSFSVESLLGERQTYFLAFHEKDLATTSYIGRFENGKKFRLIQPDDFALMHSNSVNNAIGGFSLGSESPNGWAVFFFLTEQNDLRQTNIEVNGSKEQIQRIINGSMMAFRFGKPEKFVEFSKRILPMIENNPSQLNEFEESGEFIKVLREYSYVYERDEIEIINKIKV